MGLKASSGLAKGCEGPTGRQAWVCHEGWGEEQLGNRVWKKRSQARVSHMGAGEVLSTWAILSPGVIRTDLSPVPHPPGPQAVQQTQDPVKQRPQKATHNVYTQPETWNPTIPTMGRRSQCSQGNSGQL